MINIDGNDEYHGTIEPEDWPKLRRVVPGAQVGLLQNGSSFSSSSTIMEVVFAMDSIV